MRLAGTCSRYSNKAIPQLASAATYQGRSERFFRCAYQANVMKTFDPISSSVVGTTAGIPLSSRASESTIHLQRPQRRHGRLIPAMYDAVPTARPCRADVLGTVVDEHGLGGREVEAAFGFNVNPRVRFHYASQVGQQHAVTDSVQAVLAGEMGPVNVSDVRQQVHAIVLAQPVRQIHHRRVQLEHVDPFRLQAFECRRPFGERCHASEQPAAVQTPAFMVLERDALAEGLDILDPGPMLGQKVDDRLRMQVHQHPADIKYDVVDQAARPPKPCGRSFFLPPSHSARVCARTPRARWRAAWHWSPA